MKDTLNSIPLFNIYWNDEDLKAVADIISSGRDWAVGQSIERFESGLAEYTGRKYCVVFNSGTSALHAILLAYGIKGEDEVIVPSFTFISTANSVLFVDARPVFADIEQKTCGLDPDDVEKRITNKTKAIIPVHYGGCPCMIRELREIASKHGLLLIEDAAEAFGAEVGGMKVGAFGDAAMLSFCQNKIITTGEGGAALTDSKEVYEKLKLIRSHGRQEAGNYFSSSKPVDYVELGYNFRMPSLIAALGIAQLKKIDEIISMRRDNAQYLTEGLSAAAGRIITPDAPSEEYFHAYQMYNIRVSADCRDELMAHLVSKGIATKIYFSPVHQTRFYRSVRKEGVVLPVTEEVSRQTLALPMYPALTKQDIDYIAKEITSILQTS